MSTYFEIRTPVHDEDDCKAANLTKKSHRMKRNINLKQKSMKQPRPCQTFVHESLTLVAALRGKKLQSSSTIARTHTQAQANRQSHSQQGHSEIQQHSLRDFHHRSHGRVNASILMTSSYMEPQGVPTPASVINSILPSEPSVRRQGCRPTSRSEHLYTTRTTARPRI